MVGAVEARVGGRTSLLAWLPAAVAGGCQLADVWRREGAPWIGDPRRWLGPAFRQRCMRATPRSVVACGGVLEHALRLA
jgi:hypothetical protein